MGFTEFWMYVLRSVGFIYSYGKITMAPMAMRHGHRGGILGVGKTCTLIDITMFPLYV